MMKIHIGLHVNYPLFLTDLNETWTFSTDFQKKNNTQMSDFKTVRLVGGAELFYAEGRTDGRKEANSHFS
jgi:hypothetical protein